MDTWLATLGVYAIQHPGRWIPRSAGLVTLFCGVCTLISTAEQFGVQSPLIGASLYAGYVLWIVLLAVWAIFLLIRINRIAS